MMKDGDEIITVSENDVRNFGKDKNVESVIYTKDGFEIELSMTPVDTGRNEDWNVEPTYFSDAESEAYWDSNWEDIQEEVVNLLYELLSRL